MIATVAILFTSCEKSDTDNELQVTNNSTVVDNVNRPVRPIVLGKHLKNPYSVENMRIALDSLLANKDSLNGSMRAPGALNDFEINTTDLYIRYLPKDSAEYRTLMNDTTLTLFDFPLDYELKQVGEYYKDPTVTGEYTWLYTRVPVGYTPHEGIKYEVLEELFILEHSPYYTVESETDENGMQRAKSVAGRNTNEALRVLQTVSLYLTGNLTQDSKDKNTYTNDVSGMQKAKTYVTIRIFGKTIVLATLYYPSGYMKVNSYHTMNEYGDVTPSSKITDVPLKGIKMQFLTWFEWSYAYTDEYGYYKSDNPYVLNPLHIIFFSGRTKDQRNRWDLDRVWLWASCLWVQKLNLGVQSKDYYSATIEETNDTWEACVTNNAIYEYMTICDREGISRPPAHLQIALREGTKMSATPLFQNHKMDYSDNFLVGYFDKIFAYSRDLIQESGLLSTSFSMFSNSLPDILISGGDIERYINVFLDTRNVALYRHISNVWHELSHASNFQRVETESGYSVASDFWASLVTTEGWHGIATLGDDCYGKKGDVNWQQVGLVEGWAFYHEWVIMKNFLGFDALLYTNYNYIDNWRPKDYNNYNVKFPKYYSRMYDELVLIGCSYSNIEKSLKVKTFSAFRDKLIEIYPYYSDSITKIINEYEAHNF